MGSQIEPHHRLGGAPGATARGVAEASDESVKLKAVGTMGAPGVDRLAEAYVRKSYRLEREWCW